MDDIEIKKYLASVLTEEKLKENRVTLVVGYAADLVLKMMSTPCYMVTNVAEARDFVGKFSVESDSLVVVGDLYKIGVYGQAAFLKFIEDSYCPVLLLASKDNLLDTIISRCKVVIKVPVSIKYSHMSIGDFIKSRDEAEIEDDLMDLEEDSLRRCPEYFYLCHKYLTNESSRVVKNYMRLL